MSARPDNAMPLPRDISRFRKLSPEPRAVIREGADATLRCVSTIELIALDQPREG